MPYTSDMIANQIYAANAQMLGGSPGMGAPAPGGINGLNRGMAGLYGERAAAMMGSAGQFGMGAGRLGLELGMGSMGSSFGMGAASMMGMGGMGAMSMGLAASAAFTVPAIAMGSVFRAYGGAFQGGMEDQAGLNSTLRSNFNFHGGGGPMNRGFSQNQMGQIGSMISGEMRRNPFANSQELNGLIAGGADSGMMTGVRDVQQFTQNFRRMLDTLRSVQRELGGTLTDALGFVRSSQQAGIFQNADRVNFAAEVRSAEAVTGMDRTQLTALAATGATIARSVGGYGRQGAYGALRGAQTLGAALSSGSIDAETLSEATGGLTGADAIASFTQSTMARSGRFARTGAGRFSTFALSNADGTGLDQDMLRRFQTGDISVGDISRRAHENVGRMGRARAINREGALRGELMEDGGMSAQIGIMRLMLGDRVADRGDDFSQLVMQRRFHMSRPESEVWSGLLRNQGRIAERESFDRMGSRREADYNTDLRENRSVDAFMTNFEHGASEMSGLTAAREAGRNFVSRVSSIAERTMNAVLGTATSSLSEGDRAAINRISIGRGTAADLELVGSAGTGAGNVTSESLFAGSLAGNTLHALGMHGMSSIGDRLERRGVGGLRGADGAMNARLALDAARDAANGNVTGASRDTLERLEGDVDRTTRRISEARMIAGALGDPSMLYAAMGEDANATDAFMARNGLAAVGATPGRGSLMGLGGAGIRGTLGAVGGAALAGARAGMGGGLMNAIGGGLLGGASALYGLGRDPTDDAVGYLARGGHLAEDAANSGGHTRESVMAEIERQAGLARDEPGRLSAATRVLERGDIRTSLRALATEGVSEDAIRSVTGTDDFRRRINRISALGNDREGVMREINALTRTAEGLEDPAARAALASVAAQMEHNVETRGGIGSEVAGLGMSSERRAEIVDAMSDTRANAVGMSTRLEGLAGSDGLRAALGRAAAGFGDNDATAGNAGMNEALEAVIGMDPNSAEYRAMSEAIAAGGESGGAFLTSASESRRRRRDLTGGGRGGARRAGETAMNMISGGRFSDLDLEMTVGGRSRRVRSASDAFNILRRGGAGAESLNASLTAGLEGMGVTNAADLTRSFSAAAVGGFDEEEARNFDRRINDEMNGGSLGEAANRANEEALRRANPLDAQRNDLLTQIRDGIRNTSTSSSQGVDRGEA